MNHDSVDVLVIGGGINGAAIAADAAGRKLKVLLCEKGDLASGTSSWSTKLIHGGLRYLENFEFNLVRKALKEREILLQRAPHLIHPLPFIIPHQRHHRPAWLIRMGLWLYDHLAKRNRTPGSSKVPLSTHPAGQPLKEAPSIGFQYYDAQTDDCRLVIANAQSAFEQGAQIITQTQCIQAQPGKTHWQVQLRDELTQKISIVQAKLIVNATGPWASTTHQWIANQDLQCNIKLIKGSHLVVKRQYDADVGYLLQSEDGRVIFALPYLNDYTLIGTTEIDYSGSPDDATIEQNEIDYLVKAYNHYFKQPIQAQDILWQYSGVRSLHYETKSQKDKNNTAFGKITREHKIEMNVVSHLPVIHVIGGKLTSHRVLAEEVVSHYIAPYFNNTHGPWTATQPLPGGRVPHSNFENNVIHYQEKYPYLPAAVVRHYLGHYGDQIDCLLASTSSLNDLGQHIGGTLYAIEIDYLLASEWAVTAEDILWRRTKYGLKLNLEQRKAVQSYLNEPTNASDNVNQNTVE